ncbi:serine/threonine-protein kinase [Streptomyces sp. NPDC091292]|uniref:serine/threonine-protein kinase n=1 Tax=Streptomyces sp. NPDC091292 TaxID=3365991 RepID=UPI0038226965
MEQDPSSEGHGPAEGDGSHGSEPPGGPRLIGDRYRLTSPLGEGGMGTVWRAFDEVLHREVAVKEVRAPAGLPQPDVERLYARLEREAWAAARVAHRNVVTVYDVAAEGGRPWIVMELVRGLSLSDVLDAEGPMPARRAAEVGAEVLAALRAAHEAGVLHRDVKPGNVLVANDGRIVLTDFGIATVEGTSALTMTGEVIGSPEFLAPERALGRRPGPESDLWSLGVLLYAAVEGQSPFRQETPLNTLRAVVDEALPPSRFAGPLAPVIEGLLRKDPADRMPADEAERALRLVAAGGTAPQTVAGGPLHPSQLPTVVAPMDPGPGSRHGQPGRGSSPTPPLPSPYPAPSTTDPGTRRPRRTALAVAAAVAVLALALGGLTYALLNRDDGGDGNTGAGGGQTDTGAPVVSGSAGESSAKSPGPSTSGGASASSGSGKTGGAAGGGHTTPAQSVRVTVTADRSTYTGSCPPPSAEAPSFTAAFTVGRVPVDVEYRWVTRSGEASDPGWKTLSFPSGGGKSKQVTHVELSYTADAAYENEIGVEVRGPVRVTSNLVAFSVTCRTETPTGGVSSTPDA